MARRRTVAGFGSLNRRKRFAGVVVNRMPVSEKGWGLGIFRDHDALLTLCFDLKVSEGSPTSFPDSFLDP